MDLIDVKLRDLRCRLTGNLVQEKFEAFMRALSGATIPITPNRAILVGGGRIPLMPRASRPSN